VHGRCRWQGRWCRFVGVIATADATADARHAREEERRSSHMTRMQGCEHRQDARAAAADAKGDARVPATRRHRLLLPIQEAYTSACCENIAYCQLAGARDVNRNTLGGLDTRLPDASSRTRAKVSGSMHTPMAGSTFGCVLLCWRTKETPVAAAVEPLLAVNESDCAARHCRQCRAAQQHARPCPSHVACLMSRHRAGVSSQ
jgi:hypothetical protein